MSELDRLQKIADSQKREKAKIDGKIESLMEDLSEEGWDKADVAKGDMILLEKKITKMRKTFQSKLAQFKEKHANELAKVS
jgi:predicted  nucleic acid-binding Zn-ribbon protein